MSQQRGLEGLKILDFSWVIAAPVATRFLGAHGATVVKVESLSRIDVLRTNVPMAGGVNGINRCGIFDSKNSDKLGLALNLNRPGALEAARRLVRWSDVVIENFSPGTIERLGLSYHDLRQIKPDVILVSLSMQGQTGPHSRQAGFGTELQSLAGFTNLVRWPDRPPSPLSFAYTDFIVPWYAIIAIIAAIEHRLRTGEGQHIDIAQFEAGCHFIGPTLMDYLANGRLESPSGNRSSHAAPHGIYPCRGDDRWCAIAVFDDEQWRSFCAVVALPWSAEPRFSSFIQRKENEDELDRLIGEWTLPRDAEEVVSKLQAAGIPSGLVATGRDLHHDVQLQHRRHFRELDHPEMGLHSYEMPSWRLSATPGAIEMPSPCLGQHTEYICTEILGMSDQEFTQLWNEGVFE